MKRWFNLLAIWLTNVLLSSGILPKEQLRIQLIKELGSQKNTASMVSEPKFMELCARVGLDKKQIAKIASEHRPP